MLKKIKAFGKRVTRPASHTVEELQARYPQYEIGRGTYGNPEIHSENEEATLKIGAFCSIASGVKIFLGGEHRADWVTTYPFNVYWEKGRQISGHPKTKGDVIIGNDVWIGADAVILSGVSIGDGAVIGARALVASDVAPYAIHTGNPARLLKKRFDESTIQELLALEWWNLKDAVIEQLLPLMLDTDIRKFISEASRIAALCKTS